MALNEGLNNLLATTGGVIGGAAGMGASKVIERLGKLGSRPNNFADEGVKNQAIEILRRESGAAIPEGELQATMDMLRSNTETGAAMPPMSGAAMPPMSGAVMPPMSGATTGMNNLRRESGSVINEAELMNALRSETGAVVNEAELDIARQAVEKTMSPEELNAAINALMMQKQGTNDPEELEEIDEAIQSTIVQGQAPYNDLMNQLALTGGEDDMIAHVRTGDINLSRELVTPQIESLIEDEAMKSGIDPETIVFGKGIANLRNPITGREQHGWLKKTAKSIKKKGRVIAQVASVIPGPWTIPATIATKAYTAYDVAKGNISPIQAAAQWAGANKAAAGAKASIAAGTQPSGNIFARTKEYFMKGGDDMNFLDNITKAPDFNAKTGEMSGGSIFGRAKEYLLPGQDEVGLLGNLGQTFGMGGGNQKSEYTPMSDTMDGPITGYRDASGNIITVDQYNQLGSFFGGQTPQGIKSIGDAIGLGGQSGLSDFYGGMTGGQGGQGGGIGGLGGLAGMALAGGIAGKLGKLAYDEAKDSKGVSLSPVVAMDATGRYNLEAEMARRMGQQAPNPVEFGLLPANTFPQLSGGQRLSQAFNNEDPQPMMYGGSVQNFKDGGPGIAALRKVAPEVVERMGYNMGGYVMPMAYAEGGNVAMEDFNRMNGQINGEGTETSDDIPAMLSDGEFVMTGQAVRGAGSYKMTNDSGIVTLTPSGKPSRDAGTETMYQLMEAFSSRTGPA